MLAAYLPERGLARAERRTATRGFDPTLRRSGRGIFFLVGRLGLQRSVHGDVCEVEEERLVLIVGAEVLDVPDRFVGQIVGEVVASGYSSTSTTELSEIS